MWLLKYKSPTGRLARWALEIQGHDFDIQHRKGKYNDVADALSRHIATNRSINALEPLDDFQARIRVDAEKDQWYQQMARCVEHGCEEGTKLQRESEFFESRDGLLYRRVLVKQDPYLVLVVPETLRKRVLFAIHDSVTAGHLGIEKTLDKTRRRFYWPGIIQSVKDYVQGCESCQLRKRAYRALKPGELMPIPVGKPFDRVAMDFFGPLPKTSRGNQYILVATDYLTRYVEL
jgi:hypothetical protein